MDFPREIKQIPVLISLYETKRAALGRQSVGVGSFAKGEVDGSNGLYNSLVGVKDIKQAVKRSVTPASKQTK